MAFKSLMLLVVLAVCAHGAVVPAPLAIAPYASSYAAQVTHHSVAAPAAPLVAAPAASLVGTPMGAGPVDPLITVPVAGAAASLVAAPIVSSVVPQYVPSAGLLLK